MIDLRCGDYRETLADIGEVSCVITDPPYGSRTHGGQRHGRRGAGYSDSLVSTVGLEYGGWSADDVAEFVAFFCARSRGWFCAFTSHDLCAAYADAFDAAGWYSFAPIACVQIGMNVRLAGDGPSNWTTWLVVARPRSFRHWGTLPGAYVMSSERGPDRADRVVRGGKPLDLMRAIVRDYSRPGDVVCDPCAGGATTLIAAVIEGRRAIGSELDPATHAKALNRIATSGEIERYAPSDVLKHAKQSRLPL
jgi:site-specific DNA-methyltransferase (adenine-specific)